ncbi:putative F-box associated interaction domain-containing protein [Medicago truncatula]|uniref:F-box protein interaction domain protein n=1 Tax=Medicago truncatula TaxID=3880 RepID=A0A072UVL4_MEDTR|nr:F-box/kelch-repeat protein At3g23880 [Medicago truncatula]KEH33128.1 F-box protein interaction domain protein [Medicago truncatula]RHN66044.1 putative F-box associated interaction domain-containing protein [Medicago truncatula]
MCRLHCVSYDSSNKILKSDPFDKDLKSYSLDSIFTNIISNVTKFDYAPNNFKLCFYSIVGSCNGILCIASEYIDLVILWNPSIRKVKELPIFERPRNISIQMMTFGFGYDSFSDNYKVIIVFRCSIRESSGNLVNKTKVKVHTLGTNYWKIIPEFPFGGVPIERTGKFVSGTINWLTSIEFYRESPYFIVSYDLGKESYQEVLLPDCRGADAFHLRLCVLRDCLCILAGHDVWSMKEYGNKESWTKLFTISYLHDSTTYYTCTEVIYIFEDDQVLLKVEGGWKSKLVLYNSRNGTFQFTKFDPTPKVCIESLISPCSYR